jgi:hypothetical protein
MRKWIQTWANYYSHLTRNMTDVKTHKTLDEERTRQMRTITTAKEHLEGICLFYSQSHLADPHPPGEKERGPVSLSNGEAAMHTRELSDREI